MRIWTQARRRVIRFALGHPALMALLTFLFLAALFNQLYQTTEETLTVSPFWHMVGLGCIMATFGAGLLHELIRSTRRVSELEMVRTIANTLLHEINNPLQVITSAAEMLRQSPGSSRTDIDQILQYTARIRERVQYLGGLEFQIHRVRDPNINLIDLDRSH